MAPQVRVYYCGQVDTIKKALVQKVNALLAGLGLEADLGYLDEGVPVEETSEPCVVLETHASGSFLVCASAPPLFAGGVTESSECLRIRFEHAPRDD